MKKGSGVEVLVREDGREPTDAGKEGLRKTARLETFQRFRWKSTVDLRSMHTFMKLQVFEI